MFFLKSEKVEVGAKKNQVAQNEYNIPAYTYLCFKNDRYVKLGGKKLGKLQSLRSSHPRTKIKYKISYHVQRSSLIYPREGGIRKGKKGTTTRRGQVHMSHHVQARESVGRKINHIIHVVRLNYCGIFLAVPK